MDAAMRFHLHLPLSHRHTFGTGVGRCDDLSTAEALLAGDPLARLLRDRRTGFHQLISVTAAQAAGLGIHAAGNEFGVALAGAGAAVQLVLACRLAALRSALRQLCVEAIGEGRASLPLACVQREARRLAEPRTVRQLARSLEQVTDMAARPPGPPAAGTLVTPGVVRELSPELRQVVALLRSEDVPVRGLAAVELLLTGPATPLYGGRVEPLREELGRARYLLSAKS
jgi:hypothetical protein